MAQSKSPQMPAATNPNWTPAHESALSGLVGLGISKKEARAFLESMKGGDVATLMRSALAQRNRAQAPPSAVSGGPSGARPIQATPPPLPPAAQAPPPPPATSGPQQKPAKGDAIGSIINFMLGSQAAKAGPGRSVPPPLPPKAPIGPAAAQLASPGPSTPPAPPGPQQKPRIRVRAAGGPVPPAPIGGQAPTVGAGSPTEAPQPPTQGAQAPSTEEAEPPRIRSKEEYQQLPPGTRFVWIPDGHIYRKPAEGGEQ